MKLFFIVPILLVLVSCNPNQNQTAQGKSEVETTAKIIEKVKSRNISDSLTIAQALLILAEDEGEVSWQIFKPTEFLNDPNIVGVIGTTINGGIGVVPFKVWYLYHKDSEKITYYHGEIAGNSIQEIQILISIEQLKMFDNNEK